MDRAILAKLTADVVSSYVGNRTLTEGELERAVDRLPLLINSVHEALARILQADEALREAVGGGGLEAPGEPSPPPVVVENSVAPDYIVCLEDGRQFKTLARHLQSKHGLTPEQYRAKWNLPDDYPMACADYAQARSVVAKRIGLGVDGRGSKPAFAKRGRKASKRA